MTHGNGVSRGDRNRERTAHEVAGSGPGVERIVRIDLAERKQMVVVTNHDSKGRYPDAETVLEAAVVMGGRPDRWVNAGDIQDEYAALREVTQ